MRVMNAVEGFTDASGQFHPIRGSADYDPGSVGEKKKKARKRKTARKAVGRKTTGRKATGRKKPRKAVVSRSGRLARKAKKAVASGRKRNPLPMGKFVKARVRRRPCGQIDVLVEKKKR